MGDYAWDQEIPPEELKASGYYLDCIDRLGAELGTTGWPKELRLQASSYVRHPNEHMLTRLADFLAEQANNPSAKELEMIKYSGSSIADRIDPAITLALIYGRALDAVKVKTIGYKTPTTSINNLMSMLFAEISWRAEGIDKADTEDLLRLAAAAAKLENPGIHWYVPKILPLVQGFTSKQKALETLSAIKPEEEKTIAEELAAANDELMASIVALQKYGLKPCVAPALPHGKTKEWLVIDAREENDRVAGYNPASRHLAHFYGSLKPIKSTEVQRVSYKSAFDEHNVIKLDARIHPGLDYNARTCDIALGSDGHLYYTAGVKWFDHINPSMRVGYEQLRAEVLSIYFDSVVPVYVTEKVKEIDGSATKGILGRVALSLKKKPDLRRLVLARTRVIKEEIRNVIEELENPESDLVGENREKGKMTKHEVEWFIRRLPSNFRASPEARDLCLKETGIVLAEYGETYVRKHTRGSLESTTKGHKVSFATGKIATKLGKRK